jgi:hypothetical protein
VRPAKSTCSRLLRACEELTEAERHDLAEVLSRWSHGEEHARRVVLALPARPTAIDIRKAAARLRPATPQTRPQQGCPRCFGSGFAIQLGPHGYTGAHPCDCVTEQPELFLTTADRDQNRTA